MKKETKRLQLLKEIFKDFHFSIREAERESIRPSNIICYIQTGKDEIALKISNALLNQIDFKKDTNIKNFGNQIARSLNYELQYNLTKELCDSAKNHNIPSEDRYTRHKITVCTTVSEDEEPIIIMHPNHFKDLLCGRYQNRMY